MVSKKGWIFGIIGAAVVIGLVAYIVVLVVDNNDSSEQDSGLVWGFKCVNNQCKRVEIAKNRNTSSMSVCRLTCSDDIGTLLPKPSQKLTFSKTTVALNYFEFIYQLNLTTSSVVSAWQESWVRFQQFQYRKLSIPASRLKVGKKLRVSVYLSSNDLTLNHATDESYKLSITSANDQVDVKISSTNYYGARHALETLDQLIVFDDFKDELVILEAVEIEDAPKYKHRGISMDTSRNYYTVEDIKRVIDGLAMVKLNVYHWHISDAQAMPLDLKSRPELTKLGAYSPDKVYTAHDITEIVHHAKIRGVRVIPEFDTPSHVGEGWQNTNLTMCYKDPTVPPQWRGHFDPTKEELYEYIGDIFGEIVEAFQPTLFHMGGDEVSISCWNTSASIREWMTTRMGWGVEKSDFMKLWSHYQENAIAKLDNALSEHNLGKIPIVVWSSSLTEQPYLSELLDKDRFIVQAWMNSTDEVEKAQITALLQNGYRVIMSNSDALYLDCGVGWWVDEGLNWCSPYKIWQKLYDNRMETIAGSYIDQIYGVEAAIWSESVGSETIDMRIFPRVSALAERLWTNPDDHWRKFEPRLLWNNQRLSEIGGLAPERLQLEWCLQNEGDCS